MMIDVRRSMNVCLAALVPLAAILLAGCMSYMSDPIGPKPQFRAELSAAGEKPPTESAGYGVMEVRYLPTMRMLEWKLYFGKLSGPITYAFLQGPDGAGAESVDIVPINPPYPSNVHYGSVMITEAQAADLVAGRWSVNLKTEKFPSGEISGTLVRHR